MEELPTKSDISSSIDLSVAKTHYEILGVDEKADFDAIKRAHRKLALRYHPDKQRQAGNEGGKEEDASTSIFTKIQTAWECLSDREKRISYDDSLTRSRERSAGDIIKAQAVKLSEMQCELCDVEDEDVETSDSLQGLKTQKLYSYMCRCGDYFEVLEEELKSKSGGNIFDCQSCSLSINIIN